MEESKKKKKKNKKPLFILLGFFIVFSLFIGLISMSTESQEAIKELNSTFGINEIKSVWDKHKVNLYQDEDFVFALREKLSKIDLNEAEIKECVAWLPPRPVSLNIIVVPDLSNRIVDTINNPDQIKTDKELLRCIWESFNEITKYEKNSKDRLIIDVTDSEQASGKFRILADNLIFDLSKNKKNQINKFYLDAKIPVFSSSIDKLYEMAIENPIGANYWYYFNRRLADHMLKETLFEDYRNVIIIITDGYLEDETNERTGRAFYTGTYEERKNYCLHGSSIPKIEDCDKHFPKLEVLVMEVNERKKGSKVERKDPGTKCDYSILKEQWQNWFSTLEIKNAIEDNFILHNNSREISKNKIKEFLGSKK